MKKTNILFIVGNNYYPNDNRVYNECTSLNKDERFKCFIFAPRNYKKKEKFLEIIEEVMCFRFPFFESNSMKSILFEYIILLFWLAFFAPLIVLLFRIKIIHVANPPDFILLSFCWLKLFGVKFIFDQHDITIEQFKMRNSKKNIKSIFFLALIRLFEKWSIQLSDLVIATNTSIKDYEHRIVKDKKIIIVRNSNKTLYLDVGDIPKNKNKVLHLGYIGSLSYHSHAGIESLKNIALFLQEKKIDFTFSIIGDGGGMTILKEILKDDNLENNFNFYGWLYIKDAFKEIVNFDFGISPLTVCSSNNIHTASKLMDYMCCAVPVCTLKLHEQIKTTNNIGIHVDSFEEMVVEIVKTYNDKKLYEELRKKTLIRFNEDLCWEKQEITLIKGYNELFPI